MDIKVLNKLEYPAIIRRLEDHCSTMMGKETAAILLPMKDMYEIDRALDETTEAKTLQRLFPSFTMGGVHDIRPMQKRAAVGGIIEAPEFLMLYDTLRAADRIRSFLRDPELSYPILKEIAGGIHGFSVLEQKIRKVITQEGEVSDNASPELTKLRKQLRSLQGKAREKMESMIRNPDTLKYLQDPIITIRNDRYVIPVRQEYRQQVPGLIHDQSGSGATLFIEPIQVVEINNETQRCESMERAEVTRILRALTELVQGEAEALEETVESLTQLDFALAKGKLSAAMDCGRPLMNPSGILRLLQAKHPLIPGKVVPITVSLGDDFDAMIVTGPNTGGKTVILKTVGLLTLMAQAGLHVPAENGTELSVFQNVFADIGDEQSIEQSLSTFSSHMNNIIGIAQKADWQSLVLLDELGAGTDPAEGAALAMSIIDYLLKRGSKIIATTHYSELKSFAYNHDRVENASVEFDVETLRPTYRVMMGVPGRSNAFEISKRLGLSDEIVDQARSFLSQEQTRTANLIANLETNQILSEKDRQEAESLRQQANQTLQWIQKKETDTKARITKQIEKAQEEALEIVQQARKESDTILKEIRELQKLGLGSLDQAAAQKAREKLKAQENKLQDNIENRQPASRVLTPAEIIPGDSVYLRRFKQKGIVLDKPNAQGEFQVQAGIMKVTVKLKDIELTQETVGKTAEVKTGAGEIASGKAKTMKPELDLRGLLVDEALEIAEKYLDDAYLGGLGQVTIIHGKGTGALRKAIQDLTRSHPFIASARLGGYHEGGDGVTVIILKK